MKAVGVRSDQWWVGVCEGQPRARVLCLPHAGGGSAAYLRWQRFMPGDIHVVSARLPGRETRLDERNFDDIETLADALFQACEPLLDRPFILFGHSMGALLAFELAHRLFDIRGVGPSCMVISGRGAPDTGASARWSTFADAALVEHIVELGGIPAEVAAEPELVALLMPGLRSDLTACERYACRQRQPLKCPIHAVIGRDDPLVHSTQAERWAAHTSAEFRLQKVTGGHFYFKHAPEPLVTLLKHLAEHARAGD